VDCPALRGQPLDECGESRLRFHGKQRRRPALDNQHSVVDRWLGSECIARDASAESEAPPGTPLRTHGRAWPAGTFPCYLPLDEQVGDAVSGVAGSSKKRCRRSVVALTGRLATTRNGSSGSSIRRVSPSLTPTRGEALNSRDLYSLSTDDCQHRLVIPWLPTPPPRPVGAPLAAPCHVSQLQIAPQLPRLGVFYDGETGSRAGWIIFHNTGAPCALVGRPAVQLLWHGRALPEQQTPEAAGIAADVLPSRFSTRALPRGRSAQLAGVWTNGSRPADAVRVTLPRGGGSVVLPQHLCARCDQPSAPSVISVGTFDALVAPPKPSTRLPLRITFDRRSYRAIPGMTLRYAITLHNTARGPSVSASAARSTSKRAVMSTRGTFSTADRSGRSRPAAR
jgi:hypothetical protein